MDEKSTAHIELENFWPYQVVVLADQISRHTLSVVREQSGLNLSQWRVLAAVALKFMKKFQKNSIGNSASPKSIGFLPSASLKLSRVISVGCDRSILKTWTMLKKVKRGQGVFDDLMPINANNKISLEYRIPRVFNA